MRMIFLKLATLLTLFSIIGCGCDDCGEPPEPPQIEPFYINNSGVTVKLITKEDLDYRLKVIRLEINNNDTLCNQHMESESCATPYWGVDVYDDNSAYFKIEFFTEPKVCLLFAEESKLKNDIRYLENYKFMKESSTTHYYSYTITPEHRAMATEKACLDSIGE